MEQLFRMPIKGRLNFIAKPRQINHQPTLNRAFKHFSHSFYKFMSNISRFLAYFISKYLFIKLSCFNNSISSQILQ